MADSDVIKVGFDPTGRPVLMSRYMKRVWDRILDDPAVQPFAFNVVIVQGAHMASLPGGGAEASAGYHDRGGCIDIRTWNLTNAELEAFIRTSRRYAFPFWRRDEQHGGFEPHAHGVLGTDFDLTAGAKFQWSEYINDRDGLSSRGPDYEWRPTPLVLKPPEPEEDTVTPEDREAIAELAVQKLLKTRLMGMDDAPDGRYLGATLSNIHDMLRKLTAEKEA